MEYDCVEVSGALCETIESRLKATYSQYYDSAKVKIYNSSIFDYKIKDDIPSFVIGMEILDNMPHDRLYRKGGNIDEPWAYQAIVRKSVSTELNANDL